MLLIGAILFPFGEIWLISGIVLITIGFMCVLSGWLGLKEEKQKYGKKIKSTKMGRLALFLGIISVFSIKTPPFSILISIPAIFSGFIAVRNGDNEYGMYIHASNFSTAIGDFLINYNTILNAEYGIYLNDTGNATISRNEISDGEHGIYLNASSNNTITYNMLINNTAVAVPTGLHVDADSNDNEIHMNCFIRNDYQAYDDGQRNNWDNNYWSDFPLDGWTYNIEGSANSQDHYTLEKCPLIRAAAVPVFTPIGMLLLVGLTSLLAVIAIRRKRKLNLYPFFSLFLRFHQLIPPYVKWIFIFFRLNDIIIQHSTLKEKRIYKKLYQKGEMKINIFLAVVCLFTVVFSCGCLESGEGNIITMTLEELVNDYNQSVDNDTKKITIWFESLNEGDALIISDTLNNITYSESHNYTLIELESLLGYPFPIEGNIIDKFRKGDNIELKMHIINITYTQQNPNTGETWAFELETFKEGWDSENNTSIPIPQKCIRSLDNGKGKVITMTMDEFINDSEQHIDNDTKIFSNWQKSLNEGDTLIIRDTINYIIYNESDDNTFIEFESALGNGFPIEGDITDKFLKGDTIELKVHIIEVTFTQQIYGETWTIELETFKEG